MANTNQDEEIQSTNNDATNSKFIAVKLGYWSDPYVQYFSKPTDRKPPELNRGYYARVKGIELILGQFLKKTDLQCQVINLGAGSDTSYWKFSDQNLVPMKWVELDFQPVVDQKIRIIRSKKPLLNKLQINSCHDGPFVSSPSSTQMKPKEIHSAIYHIVPCDLRDLTQFECALNKCEIDYSIPTIFICECVFIYMEPSSSSQLLKIIADKFQDVFFVNYEQVNMNDRFGEVMIHNLQMRGCALAGVKHCLNLQTHFDRFLKNGWQGADGGDMLKIYESLPQNDVQRIEKLEFLDDREMLIQLFTHYCITWSYKQSNVIKDHISTLVNNCNLYNNHQQNQQFVQHNFDFSDISLFFKQQI